MTTQEIPHVLSVKVSKPEYHATTFSSSSASRDCASDYASEGSSTTPAGYETPPSRLSTPTQQSPRGTTEMAFPERPAAVIPAPLTIRHVESDDEQIPPRPLRLPRSLDDLSPPTPSDNDTPYIRFAIEQLTFDEEVTGRPRYPSRADDDFDVLRSIARDLIDEPPPPVRSGNPPSRPPQPFRFPSESLERQRSQPRDLLLPIDPPDGSEYPRLAHVPTPLRLHAIAPLVLLCAFMIAAITISNIHALRSHGLYDYDGDTTARYFIFQYLPQMVGMIIVLWLFVIQAAIYRALPFFSMSAELPHDRVLQNQPIVQANYVVPDFRFFRLGEPLVGLSLLAFWIVNFTIPLLSCFYQTKYYTDIQPSRWRWSTVQGLGWSLVGLYGILIGALMYVLLRFRSRKSALMWDPLSLADLILIFQRSNILTDFEQSEVWADLKSQLPPRFLRMGYWTPSNSPEIYHTIGQHNGPLNRLSLQAELAPEKTIKNPNATTDSFDIERHRYSHDSTFTRDIHSPFVRYRWTPWCLRDGPVLAWIIAAVLLLIAFLTVSYVDLAALKGFLPLLPSATRADGFSPADFLYSFIPALLGMALFLFWQPIDTAYRSIQPFANLATPAGVTAQRSLLLTYLSLPPVIATVTALRNRDIKVAYVTFISLLSTSIPILAGGVFSAQLFSDTVVRVVASSPGYIALSVLLTIYALSYIIVWPTRIRYLPHSICTIAGQLSFLYASPLLNDPTIRSARTRPELTSRLCGYVGGITSYSRNNSEASPGGKSASVLTGEYRARFRRPSLGARHSGRGNTYVDRQLKYAFGIYIGRDGKEHLGIDRLQRPGSGEMLVVTGGPRSSLGSRSRRSRRSIGVAL